MGLVFAATHVTLGSRAAIKLLRPSLASRPDARGRLLREARVAARLRGEYVVRVYDVGECDDGAPFLVMELLDGVDFEAHLRAFGPLPLGAAAALVGQACEAMARAHAAGVVHRDLKPSNLFLSRRQDSGALVKVLDFGASKDLSPDPSLPPDGVLSRRDLVIGTAAYMAPEQARGARDVDARCDVWALGVVLFEALTGCLPFLGRTSAEASPGRAEPPWAALPASTPTPVRQALARCLLRDPARRLPSARALAEALAPFASPRAAIVLSAPPAGAPPCVSPDAITLAAPDVEPLASHGRSRRSAAPSAPNLVSAWLARLRRALRDDDGSRR